jgi:hypothetical protein
MAFADLREWICSLEEKGELRRIKVKERFLSRVEPGTVQGGPVKENVITAEAIDTGGLHHLSE